MAEFGTILDKAFFLKFSGNAIYYFAFGTIVVSGDDMHIKFFNGVEQRFKFEQFTTNEPTFMAYIESLIALDYFRVPVTDEGGSTTGLSTAANQLLQLTQETLSNTKLDTLIAGNATANANNATALNQYLSETLLDKILKELKENNKLLRKILN